MRRKGTVIAAIAVAALLLVSLGVAIAAGTSSETRRGAEVGEAEEALRFACRNAGEGDRIRAENCEGMEERECSGDCDRVRERLQDGTRDGECTQERKRAGE